jgi:hypothetical protein
MVPEGALFSNAGYNPVELKGITCPDEYRG